MFPIIQIGPLKFASFTVMAFLGIVAFILFAILLVEKIEKTERKSVNCLLIVSVIGFGILYGSAFVINSLFHSIAEKKIIIGGITWLGGVLVAFPALVVLIHFLCPRVKGNALFYFNLLIPAIVLAHAFGRVGCFLGGCCYGGRTDGIFGVSFPVGSPCAHAQYHDGLIGKFDKSLPVYPTQLFEAIFELCLFLFMMITYKKLKRHFAETYCFGYGVFRFGIEFLRDDNRGSTGFFLSPSQLMSILLIVLGVLLILYHKRVIFKKLYDKMERYRQEAVLYGVHLQADTNFAIGRLKALHKDGLLLEEEVLEIKVLLEKRLKEKPEIKAQPKEIPTDEPSAE